MESSPSSAVLRLRPAALSSVLSTEDALVRDFTASAPGAAPFAEVAGAAENIHAPAAKCTCSAEKSSNSAAVEGPPDVPQTTAAALAAAHTPSSPAVGDSTASVPGEVFKDCLSFLPSLRFWQRCGKPLVCWKENAVEGASPQCASSLSSSEKSPLDLFPTTGEGAAGAEAAAACNFSPTSAAATPRYKGSRGRPFSFEFAAALLRRQQSFPRRCLVFIQLLHAVLWWTAATASLASSRAAVVVLAFPLSLYVFQKRKQKATAVHEAAAVSAAASPTREVPAAQAPAAADIKAEETAPDIAAAETLTGGKGLTCVSCTKASRTGVEAHRSSLSTKLAGVADAAASSNSSSKVQSGDSSMSYGGRNKGAKNVAAQQPFYLRVPAKEKRIIYVFDWKGWTFVGLTSVASFISGLDMLLLLLWRNEWATIDDVIFTYVKAHAHHCYRLLLLSVFWWLYTVLLLLCICCCLLPRLFLSAPLPPPPQPATTDKRRSDTYQKSCCSCDRKAAEVGRGKSTARKCSASIPLCAADSSGSTSVGCRSFMASGLRCRRCSLVRSTSADAAAFSLCRELHVTDSPGQLYSYFSLSAGGGDAAAAALEDIPAAEIAAAPARSRSFTSGDFAFSSSFSAEVPLRLSPAGQDQSFRKSAAVALGGTMPAGGCVVALSTYAAIPAAPEDKTDPFNAAVGPASPRETKKGREETAAETFYLLAERIVSVHVSLLHMMTVIAVLLPETTLIILTRYVAPELYQSVYFFIQFYSPFIYPVLLSLITLLLAAVLLEPLYCSPHLLLEVPSTEAGGKTSCRFACRPLLHPGAASSSSSPSPRYAGAAGFAFLPASRAVFPPIFDSAAAVPTHSDNTDTCSQRLPGLRLTAAHSHQAYLPPDVLSAAAAIPSTVGAAVALPDPAAAAPCAPLSLRSDDTEAVALEDLYHVATDAVDASLSAIAASTSYGDSTRVVDYYAESAVLEAPANRVHPAAGPADNFATSDDIPLLPRLHAPVDHARAAMAATREKSFALRAFTGWRGQRQLLCKQELHADQPVEPPQAQHQKQQQQPLQPLRQQPYTCQPQLEERENPPQPVTPQRQQDPVQARSYHLSKTATLVKSRRVGGSPFVFWCVCVLVVLWVLLLVVPFIPFFVSSPCLLRADMQYQRLQRYSVPFRHRHAAPLSKVTTVKRTAGGGGGEGKAEKLIKARSKVEAGFEKTEQRNSRGDQIEGKTAAAAAGEANQDAHAQGADSAGEGENLAKAASYPVAEPLVGGKSESKVAAAAAAGKDAAREAVALHIESRQAVGGRQEAAIDSPGEAESPVTKRRKSPAAAAVATAAWPDDLYAASAPAQQVATQPSTAESTPITRGTAPDTELETRTVRGTVFGTEKALLDTASSTALSPTAQKKSQAAGAASRQAAQPSPAPRAVAAHQASRQGVRGLSLAEAAPEIQLSPGEALPRTLSTKIVDTPTGVAARLISSFLAAASGAETTARLERGRTASASKEAFVAERQKQQRLVREKRSDNTAALSKGAAMNRLLAHEDNRGRAEVIGADARRQRSAGERQHKWDGHWTEPAHPTVYRRDVALFPAPGPLPGALPRIAGAVDILDVGADGRANAEVLAEKYANVAGTADGQLEELNEEAAGAGQSVTGGARNALEGGGVIAREAVADAVVGARRTAAGQRGGVTKTGYAGVAEIREDEDSGGKTRANVIPRSTEKAHSPESIIEDEDAATVSSSSALSVEAPVVDSFFQRVFPNSLRNAASHLCRWTWNVWDELQRDPLTLLPPKPLLIGHRGVPALRPENTESSFVAASDMCDALETDVNISSEGVLLLNHDKTFKRTTDVASVFSEKADNRADSFDWGSTQQLNAGKWWLALDPFWKLSTLDSTARRTVATQTASSEAVGGRMYVFWYPMCAPMTTQLCFFLTASWGAAAIKPLKPEAQSYAHFYVPSEALFLYQILSLEQLLKHLVKTQKKLLFDLNCPSCGESPWGCNHRCEDGVIKLMRLTNSGKYILWMQEKADEVKREFPEATIVRNVDLGRFEPDAERLRRQEEHTSPQAQQEASTKIPHPEMLNTDWRFTPAASVKRWMKAGYWVNIYVVNAPWVVSYFWCAGANSMTTDNCSRTRKQEAPSYAYTLYAFQVFALLLDVTSILVVVLCSILRRYMENMRRSSCFTTHGDTNTASGSSSVPNSSSSYEKT